MEERGALLRIIGRVTTALESAREEGRSVVAVTAEDAEVLVSFLRWGPLPLWQRVLLAKLEQGADISAACRDAGVSKMTYYRWLRISPAFREACGDVFRHVGYPRLRWRWWESESA